MGQCAHPEGCATEQAQRANHEHSAVLGPEGRWVSARIPKGAPLSKRLPGGWMSGSRLVGGQVRRPVGPHTPFVHDLLRHLEAAGFPGAPRVVGIDGGEEVLTYVQGHVPVEVAPTAIRPIVFSPEGVASAFALIRRYHDVVAGIPLAGGAEVVCHGDLSPWNTVYGERGAVALIDWDGAAPGSRLADVGYATWRYLMLGFPASPPLDEQRRLLAAAAGGYGLYDRAALLDAASAAQDAQRRHFEAAHDVGDPRYVRLIGLGALGAITNAQRWLDAARGRLLR